MNFTLYKEWLDCDDIKRIKMGRRLKFGLGKEVFDAVWNDHKVAYVRLRPERLHQGPIRDRVRTGIQHLIQLQPSPYVTKVLGMIDSEKLTLDTYWCHESRDFPPRFWV